MIGSEKRNLTPPKKTRQRKRFPRRFVERGSFQQNDGDSRRNVEQRVEQISVSSAHPCKAQPSQHGPDKMRCLGNAGVKRHRVGQMRARHEVGDQRHARRIEHDVERRCDRCAGENMPNLDSLRKRQDSERNRHQEISEGRDQEYFLSIEKIRERAAE